MTEQVSPGAVAPSRSVHTGLVTEEPVDTHGEEDIRFREIIHPDDSRSEILYKEALAGVIGIRATNIDEGSEIFVPINDGEDSIVIALREVIARRSPIKVLIPISHSGNKYRYEQWSVNDMTHMPNISKILETLERHLPRG